MKPFVLMTVAVVCVALLCGGCPEQVLGPAPILRPDQINGSWDSELDRGDTGGCFTFDGGRIVLWSALCDGVNDLRAETSFSLDGNEFRISFPAVFTDVSTVQETVVFEGTVTGENTISGALSVISGGTTLSVKGQLVRRS